MEHQDFSSSGVAQAPPSLKIVKGLNQDFRNRPQERTYGVVMIVLGVLMMFTLSGAGGMLVAMGILFILRSAHVPLKFREDHLVFKAALLTKTHHVDYNAVSGIDYEEKKIVVRYGTEKLNMLKSQFSAEDWAEIMKLFKEIRKD